MTSYIRTITVDCADPYTLGRWWSTVLDRRLGDDDFPGDPEVILLAPDGAGTDVLFIQVPEGKSVKNRLHLDLEPTDCTRDEEVQRVLALGATQVADQRRPDGSGWVVLADPEGNEFCVLRSAAERAG
ncbi:VOC family protein [Micromonospora sp. CPCC 206060]|uniref:VOC family protein n=1 Tax=Micromonospora sp. CPCC 206060 TaxID=3122406 RepID=UPI002FEEAD75